MTAKLKLFTELLVFVILNIVFSAEAKPKNLAEALIAFQASVPTIHENDSSFHGKFANLAGVLGTINPALRKAGLAVSQLPEEVDGKPGLRTTLMHTSGEQITAVTPLVLALWP